LLILSRKLQQQIVIQIGQHEVVVTVVRISDGTVRLGFNAARWIQITRAELGVQDDGELEP
jgi:carbon storage regulator CsrA